MLVHKPITTLRHILTNINLLRNLLSQKLKRIPFTLTYHPNSLQVKNIILRNFKLLNTNSETESIFKEPPLISFKRDKS